MEENRSAVLLDITENKTKKKNANKNQTAAPAIFTHYVGWMSENKQGGVIFER